MYSLLHPFLKLCRTEIDVFARMSVLCNFLLIIANVNKDNINIMNLIY